MTSENNRALLLCHFIICASFHSHQSIKTGVTVQNLKIDRWPWETIGHIFIAFPSFVHYLVAIGQLNLELQFGNAKFGWKSASFCPVWFWHLRDDLKNNRVPLLGYFKLCISFRSHLFIQARVTVRKLPIRVKISIFCPMWPPNATHYLQ